MAQKQEQEASRLVLPDYQPVAGVYDEVGLSGISSHWQELLSQLNQLGADNLNQRYSKTQRILRDDGATYRTYDESRDRTWGLDPVPLMLESQTWQHIEAGILQRSKLFDLLFKDIYGEQNLIRQGVVPPEAVFANPGFLRPCFGSSAIKEQGLLMHAVDMIRTSEDSVVVLADRTQSPSGAGHALENRTVMNRVFPTLFREIQVRRLAMFFHTLRHQLNRLAPGQDMPNIVVLTPGSRSETYFEHAYLANYLGYSLVQGRDLTVRNGYVWTKSLGGLTRVDVILRRIDDYYCDPAELKSDSYLGVPGLLEVVRSRKVTVANPIGSSALEYNVYLKYINAFAQFYMGEDLLLPTAKTYWANDPNDLEYMLDNIQQLIIKPSYKRWSDDSIIGHQLSNDKLEDLRQRMKANPLYYVAQDLMVPGNSPSWDEDHFTPRPSVIRSFAVSGDSTYKVMPGGLARTSKEGTDYIISRRLGSISKDIWVLSTEPEQPLSLWGEKNSHLPFNQEHLPTLPSRVVENMFWLGRYVVRAESALRLLRTVFIQLNHSEQLTQAGRETLLKAVTRATETFPGFTHPDNLLFHKPEGELMSVILDTKRSGSVMYSLNEMLECAEEVKPLMSADTQRVINDIRDEVQQLEYALNYDFASAPEEALDPLVTSLLAFSGLVHESMIRGYGWRFIEIGRNLERAYQTVSLIKALVVPVEKELDQDVLLETLLLTLETLITYRRRYRARTDVFSTLELTVLDNSNPRSLHYLAQELQEHIDELPLSESEGSPVFSPEKRTIIGLLHKIQLSDLRALCEENDEYERENLSDLLEHSHNMLNDLAVLLSNRYFDHMETFQQIQNDTLEDE